MSKKVVIIASGETERRSLPHLVAHLAEEGINVTEIRFPPQHRQLKVTTVVPLLQAVWSEYQYVGPPDKFVILVDVDGNQPDDTLRPFRQDFLGSLGSKVTASIQFAYAQWHLEAWFFGDSRNLRAYLRRNLGSVDTSRPDFIQNPKQHLKNLLGNVTYTSAISEAIAIQLDAQTIANHSPSFRAFLGEVRNGST